jgi:hypothetical protein
MEKSVILKITIYKINAVYMHYCIFVYNAAQIPGRNTVESLAQARYYLIAALDRFDFLK